MSTIRLRGENVAFVFECTLNKELFAEYLRVCITITLAKDDVIVLDNSSVHISKIISEVLVEFGIKVAFLPVYKKPSRIPAAVAAG